MALPLIPIIAGVGKAIGVLAKGAAKGLAKKAVAGAGKKMAGKIVGKGKKGGAIVVRQKTGIDKAAKIMGGKSSALAVIDKPKTQLGFRDINTQIDNIVGQTVSIRKIVVTQYALDKSSFEKNRKSQENLKRKKRESELESKKRSKGQLGLGISSLPGGNMVSRYLTNILLGGAILAILKNLDKIESGYDFALKNAHKIWVGVRAGLSLLKFSVKNSLKFLIKGSAKVFTSITGKIGKGLKKGRGVILKQFRKLATGIKTWGRVIIPNILKNLTKGMRVVDAIDDARNAAKATRTLSIIPKSTTLQNQLLRKRQLLSSTTTKIGGVKVVVPTKAPTIPKSLSAVYGRKGAQKLTKAMGGFKLPAPRPVPIIGPLIVLVTSLLSGEPLTHALFKSFGAGIGGFLGGFIGAAGGPLAIVGMLLGELVGEWLGDLLYTLIHDGGVGAVSNKLKNQITSLWQDFLKPVGQWIANSVGRLWGNILESESLSMNVPKILRGFLGGAERIPNPALFLNPVGWLLMGKEMSGIMMKSFFPPEANITSSPKKISQGVERSASYEEGAETVIPVPLPDLGSGMEGPLIVENRIPVLNNSSVNSTIKSRNMANLGFA